MSKNLSGILLVCKPNKESTRHNVFLTTVIAFFLTIFSTDANSQKLSGQWIGEFGDATDARGVKTTYVLEMEVNGQQISGYSYTYFTISGKRYYVICKLKGQFDQGSKSLLVNEVENIKSNTPPDFQNCLQSHQLTYFKQKDKEVLLGKWKPFEKGSNCGSGLTELERKVIPGLKSTESQVKVQQGKSKPESLVSPNAQETETESTKKNETSEEKKNIITRPVQSTPQTRSESNTATKPNLAVNDDSKKAVAEKAKEKLTKRNYQIIKTIEVTDDKLKVEIYDNGQVDGDTVSIFLNEKLLIPARMLTAKPITVDIKITEDEDTYDLIMYAESLGTIPPNTALMIVTTATNRYEINITSTEQTSGVVRFKVKRAP